MREQSASVCAALCTGAGSVGLEQVVAPPAGPSSLVLRSISGSHILSDCLQNQVSSLESEV